MARPTIVGTRVQEPVTERANRALPLHRQGMMMLKTKSVESRRILDLAALSVEDAAHAGGMIAVDVEARRLLDANPDCQIPFAHLRHAMARLAVKRGVVVEFGLRR